MESERSSRVFPSVQGIYERRKRVTNSSSDGYELILLRFRRARAVLRPRMLRACLSAVLLRSLSSRAKKASRGASSTCAMSSPLPRSRRAARLSRRRSADGAVGVGAIFIIIYRGGPTRHVSQQWAQIHSSRADPALSKYLRALRVN